MISPQKPQFWPLVIALALAAALRIAGAAGGFWLDEIWSYNLARQAHTPIEILTALRVDNNHPLNTFVMYLLGDRALWQIYRAPVVICSIATIALAWLWMKPRGRVEAIVAAGTLAVSLPMIVYGSEARGYAYAIFFMLLCLVSADRKSPHFGWRIGYAAAALGGVLAHPIFLPVLAAMAVHFGMTMRASRAFLMMHAIPILAAGAFWWGFVRNMEVGGASEMNAAEAFVQTMCLAAAYPLREGAVGTALALAAAGWTIASMVIAYRAGDDRWRLISLLIGFTLVAAIVQAIGSDQPFVLAPRYFLLAIVMILLSWAQAWSILMRRSSAARTLAVSLIGLWLAGNLWADARFVQSGRDNLLSALESIARSSPPGQITITADNTFRGQTVVRFYARYLPRDRALRYIESADLNDLPQWMLVQSGHADELPEKSIGRGALRYELTETVRHYGPSGLTWHVYRRAG